jgi:hypothetical protein
MAQRVIDFIAPIEAGKTPALRALLAQMQSDAGNNSLIPFASLRAVHFSSLVIFEDPQFGPYLIWEHNFDGELGDYADELFGKAGPGAEQVLSCCRGFTAGRASEYFLSRLVNPSAYHVGAVGRPVDRIRRERDLRDRINAFVDAQSFAGQSAETVRQQVRRFVESQPDLDWVKREEPRLTPAQRFLPWVRIGFALLLLGGPVLLILPFWVLWLRRLEKRDKPQEGNVAAAHVRELFERENFGAQNHLASMTIVKPGPFRRWTLRAVLFAANLLARTSTNGELQGIPTIHFAHWTMIDQGRRLLFLSNYGGSWGSYLDDFIDKASPGLTGIWTNTVGFPKTRFLLWEGSRDGARFKNFARSQQSPTAVFYSAYDDLTVANINNNSSLREGIYAAGDAAAWARLL